MKPLQLLSLIACLVPTTTLTMKRHTYYKKPAATVQIPLLYSLAKRSDLNGVKRCLKAGADVHEVFKGNTPLHAAALVSCKAVVEVLLEAGAHINRQNEQGFTPLFASILAPPLGYLSSEENQERKQECILFLLENGVDLNSANNKGETPLGYAFTTHNLELAELLIDNGADVRKADNNGMSPLYLAARAGNKKMVQVLLSAHASMDEDISPIIIAFQKEHFSLFEFLLEKSGFTLSEVIVSLKSDEVVIEEKQELINALHEYNNDWNIQRLYDAATYGRVEEVEQLIQDGVDVTASYGEREYTPLHKAVSMGWLDKLEDISPKDTPRYCRVVKLLLEAGAQPNVAAATGSTPLHCAADAGVPEVVKILLEAGANTNVRNKNQNSPLRLAAESDHTAVMRLLLDYHARVSDEDVVKIFSMQKWQSKAAKEVLVSTAVCVDEAIKRIQAMPNLRIKKNVISNLQHALATASVTPPLVLKQLQNDEASRLSRKHIPLDVLGELMKFVNFQN